MTGTAIQPVVYLGPMTMYVMLPDGSVRPAINRDDFAFWGGLGHYKIGSTWIGEAEVSTVFLRYDHDINWWMRIPIATPWNARIVPPPDHIPILFETMVFGGERHGDKQRYTSLQAARLGHRVWCEELWYAQKQGDAPR